MGTEIFGTFQELALLPSPSEGQIRYYEYFDIGGDGWSRTQDSVTLDSRFVKQ
jgi:hypothetical protein